MRISNANLMVLFLLENDRNRQSYSTNIQDGSKPIKIHHTRKKKKKRDCHALVKFFYDSSLSMSGMQVLDWCIRGIEYIENIEKNKFVLSVPFFDGRESWAGLMSGSPSKGLESHRITLKQFYQTECPLNQCYGAIGQPETCHRQVYKHRPRLQSRTGLEIQGVSPLAEVHPLRQLKRGPIPVYV